MSETPRQAPRGPRGGAQRGVKVKLEHPGKTLARLFSYLFRYYPVQLLIVVVCIFLNVFATVQGTLFIQTLIDQYVIPMIGVKNPDFGPLLHAILRVAGFYGIGVLAVFVRAKIMIYVGQGTLKRIRTEVFTHMERLPIRYFDQNTRGNIMSVYTNDVDTLRQTISQTLPQFLNSGITIVSVLISMFRLSLPLTLITLAMVTVMIVTTRYIASMSGKNFVRQQAALGHVNGYIEEMMAGQKVVKVFSHEEEAVRKFDELNDELFDAANKANSFGNIIGPVTMQLGNLSYVVCAIVGGLLVIRFGGLGGLTIGALASFLTFNRSFNGPINQITQLFATIIMSLAGADRVFKVLDEPEEADDGYVTLVNAKQENGVLTESAERTGLWAW